AVMPDEQATNSERAVSSNFFIGSSQRVKAVRQELYSIRIGIAGWSSIERTEAVCAVTNLQSNYHRKGFGLKDEVQPELQREYESSLITDLRRNGNTLTQGEVTIQLAE